MGYLKCYRVDDCLIIIYYGGMVCLKSNISDA